MITVESLTRNYGSFEAVKGVQFQIEKGEVVGLLGHNGAGKTTIMKMMTGFLEPSSGTVAIDGESVADNREKLQARIGYLPESSPVYPEMIVIEYLMYVAELRGIATGEQSEKVIKAIQRTKIEEKAKDPISTLSRGYKQRLGVAQAIIHEPGILILDEPTNGLDPAQIQEMRQLIKELSKEATVIISTHILQEVSAVCDRVLIVSRGELVLDSKLADLGAEGDYLLVTDKPSEEISGLLENIQGVASVSAQRGAEGSPFHTVVRTENGNGEIAPTIAERLVQQGVKLHALHPATKNLETVFLEASAQ